MIYCIRNVIQKKLGEIIRNAFEYVLRPAIYARALDAVITVCFVSLFMPIYSHAAENPPSNCDIYRKIAQDCQCKGADEYLTAYGYKYCEKFRLSSGWTLKGQVWRDETLLCLQRRVKSARSSRGCDCEMIGEDAFQSHASCYTQHFASFCDLPNEDKSKIINKMIDKSDIYSRRGIEQAVEIAWICLFHKPNAPKDNISPAFGHSR